MISYTPIFDVRQYIDITLSDVRTLYPLTRIIWSLFLPRSYFHHEKRRGAEAGCARNFNNYVLRICKSMLNTHVIGYHGRSVSVRSS